MWFDPSLWRGGPCADGRALRSASRRPCSPSRLVMIALNPLDQAARLRRRPRLRPRLSVERLTHGPAGLFRSWPSTKSTAPTPRRAAGPRRGRAARSGSPPHVQSGWDGAGEGASWDTIEGQSRRDAAHRRPSKSASEVGAQSQLHRRLRHPRSRGSLRARVPDPLQMAQRCAAGDGREAQRCADRVRPRLRRPALARGRRRRSTSPMRR